MSPRSSGTARCGEGERKPLTNDLDGHRSAHRGDYRVLTRIDEPGGVVLVVRIDHRAHVYRP